MMNLLDLGSAPTNTRMPTPGTETILILSGAIVEIKTDEPVTADVYVDDERLRRGVTEVDLTVHLDRLTEIRVEAPGYHPWGVAARRGSHRMEGPIQLIPIKPTVPDAPEA